MDTIATALSILANANKDMKLLKKAKRKFAKIPVFFQEREDGLVDIYEKEAIVTTDEGAFVAEKRMPTTVTKSTFQKEYEVEQE